MAQLLRSIGVNNSKNVEYSSHTWSGWQCIRGCGYEVAIVKDRKARQVGCKKYMTFQIVWVQDDEAEETDIR